MSGSKTATCTVCRAKMWSRAGSAAASAMVCRPCRRRRRDEAAAESQRRLTSRTCSSCGQTWEASPWSRATRCTPCRLNDCLVCGAKFKPYTRGRQRTCSISCGQVLVNRERSRR
jgi:hypothetical protein